MAILVIFTGPVSKSQYESLRTEVQWEKEQPNGGVLHAAAFDESGGIHVVDLWESTEAMNAFVEQRLMPAMKKLGISPPDVAVYPAHNINAYGLIDRHRI